MPWKDEAAGVEEEANLPPGRQLLKLVVLPTAEAIRQFIADADAGKAGPRHTAVSFFRDLDPEQVAYLTARSAVNSAAQMRRLQSAALDVAGAIIDHIEMLAFRRTDRARYQAVATQGRRRRANRHSQSALRKLLDEKGSRLSVNRTQRLHVGLKALELLSEATGLFTSDLEAAGHRTARRTLRLTEGAQVWLDRQHARCELLEPLLMPMIVRPKRWRSPFIGGYVSRRPGNRLVKADGQAQLEALLEADLTRVYEAVNHLQETPWRINRRVLEVMRAAWDGGGSLGGLPPREALPLPPMPDPEGDQEVFSRWKREAAETYEQNAAIDSKRIAVSQRLWMAAKFADEEAIYFPHALDFRGRVYPIPASALHPQADDTGKALLEFAEGAPLGSSGSRWLAIHIANLFGVDKVSFEDRINWTHDHAAQLIDSALDPLDGDRFWTQADSPYMALAACFEFADMLREGPDSVSHLPIPLDGSNSGLQHFSALLRDPTGAAAVNLVPSDKPADVYAEVARLAQAQVDTSEDPRADPWRGDKIIRKIAKRPTMTFVYSATRFGMQDMILQSLSEIDREHAERGLPPHLGGADNYDAANYLSHVLYGAISEVVSAAARAMRWLRDVAKVAAEAKTPIRWTTPDGLPIVQAYREAFGQRVQAHWRGQLVSLTLKVSEALAMEPGWIQRVTVTLPGGGARTATLAALPRYVTKNDKPRSVPLTKTLVDELPALEAQAGCAEKAKRFFPMKPSLAWYMWDQIRQDLKKQGVDVDDVTLHTLRHAPSARRHGCRSAPGLARPQRHQDHGRALPSPDPRRPAWRAGHPRIDWRVCANSIPR
ncbi:MAG: hypothetical protein JOY99_15840 [Sphingomonadaceae bacterium]|nr:hypothetical protein [Sphingomonadaceae bacterium]